MFSPAVPIYISENADNQIQKKQVPHQLSREPLVDRSVNGKSPVDKKPNSKHTTTEANLFKLKISPRPSISQISPESDLDGEDFMFSGKDLDDTYNDVWPSLFLGKEGIIRILRDYSDSKKTPPPSVESDFDYLEPELQSDPDFFELLPKEICYFQEPMLLDETFEVDLPELPTFEDLDTSL